MNTKIKILFGMLASIASFALVSISFAADFSFEKAPIVVDQTSTWINISWDKLDGATWYLVMYGTKSSSGWSYENELPDVTEWTWSFVWGLTAWTKYYVAVSAFDSEFNEVVSPELVVDFKWGSETSTSKFTMTNVEIISSTELKVSFSNDLIAEWEKDFMLTPKDNKSSEITVSEVSLEWTKDLVLKLESPLDPSLEYELVAISVADANGNTIESWVDWMVAFSTPSEFPWSENVELNSASSEDLVVPAEWEMWEDLAAWSWETDGLNAADAANSAEALPTTWPKEMFLLVLALLLAWAFAIARKRKMI